jgi:hypothetical protein
MFKRTAGIYVVAAAVGTAQKRAPGIPKEKQILDSFKGRGGFVR